MRVLAIDIGIKNLSYCLCEKSESSNILKWENINILDNTVDQKCNKLKIDELTDLLLCSLLETFDGDTIKADVVLIENQPSLKNGLMKTISVVVFTYFNMLKLMYGCIGQVNFTSPTNKLKCQLIKDKQTNKLSYKERKALSIATTREYLSTIDPAKLSWFNEQSKKDDLADAFLYCMYYFESFVFI